MAVDDNKRQRVGSSDKEATTAPSSANAGTTKTKIATWPFATIGAFVVIVVAACVILTVWATENVRESDVHVRANDQFASRDDRRDDFRDSMSSSIVSGVVAAIDDGNLTISGGGERINVATTSRTIVRGEKRNVAIDDTVTIFVHKTNDGTVVAMRIFVHNETRPKSQFEDRQRPVPAA